MVVSSDERTILFELDHLVLTEMIHLIDLSMCIRD
jgi:hypothetical protein